MAALLFLALWSTAARGQILIERNLTAADGLVDSRVYAFRQDRQGFVWIGTEAGLSRFDGVKLTSFEEAAGVPPGRILTVYETPDGTLLAGGDGGVIAFDGDRFRPLQGAPAWLSAPTVVILAGRPDGTLYAGGSKGLAARHPDGRWELLLASGKPPLDDTWIIDVLPARDGALYLATYGRGVLVLEGERSRWLSLEDSGLSPVVNALGQAGDGAVLIGTDEGLGVLRAGDLTVPPATRGISIRSIAEGGDGVFYLGTAGNGVLRLRFPTFVPAGPPLDTHHGLTEGIVNAVVALPDGPVLIGTQQGVSVFRGAVVETWTQEHGLPPGDIQGLAEDARGRIFAATARGLAVHDNGRWRLLGRHEGYPEEALTSLHIGASGRLYLAGWSGKIWIYESGSPVRTVDLPAVRAGPEIEVSGLLEGPGGVLYATTNQGFAIVQDGRARHFGRRQGFPAEAAFGLTAAADGTVYVATEEGLVTWRRGAFRLWTRKDGLPDDFVWAVQAGQDGSVRAGTRRGLAVLRAGRFQTFGTGDGLSSGVVTCIVEEGAGGLLVGTSRGVNLLDLRGSRRKVLPVHGLGRRPVNSGACLRDRRGRFWFALQSSVSVYDPAREVVRRPPRAVLTGIGYASGKGTWNVLRGTPLSVPARLNDLIFNFTGVDAAAHSMSFRLRLRNRHENWIHTPERKVHYPLLAPGEYRFEVQARNDAGLWSEPATLDLTVEPPPWWRRTGLVLSLAAAGLVLGAALAVAFRVRQLLAVERLRAAIAADLHDQIGAGLTEVAVLSEVAGRKAGDLPELERIAATSRDLIDRMGDIIWLVNPRRDSLEDLFLRLKDSFAELFAHRGAVFAMSNLNPLAGARLDMAQRQHLYLLFREALHNALKHSRCGRVELTLALRDRQLVAVLRDDGRGFDPGLPDLEGDGLSTMRRRAEKLGGQLTIESSPAGTAVRLEVEM
ncbi:MAG TPA: two-component regulator propeller domain-containing protein [Thermoanaerobaculia bacterium]